MGNCEYVDQKRSGPNGWYCSIVGGRVDYSLYHNYCNNSIRCVYCPKRGGDDRDRKAPEEKQPQKSSSYDAAVYASADSSSTTTSSSTSSYSGTGSSSIWSSKFFWFVIAFIVLFAAVYYASLSGAFRSVLQMQLDIPATVSHKEFKLSAVSCEGEKIYKVNSKKFKEDGTCKIKLEKGVNTIFMEYDDFSCFLGTLEGNNTDDFSHGSTSYEDIKEEQLRVIIVKVKDKKGNALNNFQLLVSEQIQGEQLCLSLGENGYAVLLDNETTSPILNFTIDGYEEVTTGVDMTERVVKLDLTMIEDKEKKNED